MFTQRYRGREGLQNIFRVTAARFENFSDSEAGLLTTQLLTIPMSIPPGIGLSSQSYGFSQSHAWMGELDYGDYGLGTKLSAEKLVRLNCDVGLLHFSNLHS